MRTAERTLAHLFHLPLKAPPGKEPGRLGLARTPERRRPLLIAATDTDPSA